MKKELSILNKENEKIFIETYTPSNIKSTIVFCHRITGCRKGRTLNDDYFQKLAIKLMNENYKVVLFDFSGHGNSEGNDYDVTLSKSTRELAKVIGQENINLDNINFLAFSYGATVLSNYISKNNIIPNHVVLYSPCLYPLESCFLNSKSIFGKDIVKANQDSSLKEKGYAIVGAKNFRFSGKMLNECQEFNSDYLKGISNKILCLSGTQDVILDTTYNDEFCQKNNITNIYLNASHSLYEEIETAFKYTIDFFNKE